ncbi:hypothetical protein [Gelidibacter pelagius]|uniref:Uncharacterized protein n=1 Tax=Gelidibacter pelagius TaxID=2819985 RepID=A0ABS3SX57_9FLAO|nr:hypothetical protein [Gelidibacter pelagius]MBO3100286.1 hypothetical protein [Gelidibacter pelagius]
MDKTFKIFHYASFLQYPFIIAALYYSYKPIIIGMDDFDKAELISNYNLVLLFSGIAFSFASLADIRKRTKLGNKIFGKQKNAKRWIIYMCILVLMTFTLGIYTMYFAKYEELKDLSIGIFVFGIGIIGLLRMNLEIIKTYQPEWKKSTTADTV